MIKVLCGQAGYAKYHLFVGANEHGTLLFLYLNSENDFAGDLVLDCREVPILPPSRTGETVISFNFMPRFPPDKLVALGATYVGSLQHSVAEKIRAHAPQVKTLGRSDKQFLISCAAHM